MNKEEITRRTEDNDEEIMKEKTNNEEIKVEGRDEKKRIMKRRLVPRLIVVPLSSHYLDGVRKEKERLTAAS